MDPTARVPFGKTSLHVTRLGLGSAPLGNLFQFVPEDESDATVRRAYDDGLRYFDTAPDYGWGLAERRFGRVLSALPRDNFVLSTKVGRLIRPGAPTPGSAWVRGPGQEGVNSFFDFSYDAVMRSVQESLERLQLDRVDVLFLHDPDDHEREALEGAYPALDTLRREGTVGGVGVGMNQVEMLARFARAADFDCFLLAGRYTLLEQGALEELLPLAQQKNIAIAIGGVYNSGILANPDLSPTYNYRQAPAELVERARRLGAVCERHGVPLKAAAIQFPFGHPAVTTVLSGARSVAELEENERLLRWPIPADLWAELKAERLLAEHAPTP